MILWHCLQSWLHIWSGIKCKLHILISKLVEWNTVCLNILKLYQNVQNWVYFLIKKAFIWPMITFDIFAVCSWRGTVPSILGTSSWHQWGACLPKAFQLWFWATIFYWRKHQGTHLEGICKLQSRFVRIIWSTCRVHLGRYPMIMMYNIIT